MKAPTIKALLYGRLSKVAAIVTASTLLGGAFTPLEAQPAEPSLQSAPSTSIASELAEPTLLTQATRAVEDATSPIGIAAGEALMSEAEGAIEQQNYTVAAEKLIAARKALNDVSTYYQNLSGVFLGVDSRVNNDLRALALEAAQVRDQASYQLAVVYRAQSRPDLAVPLLVEVVQSQQPTRALGQQAFQQLFELGFVSVPYDAPGGQAAQ
ncbi:MAG: hypothetical protein AAF703_22530 [Cyanobacteria bacterium P01_D01_bin.105]